MNNKSNEIWKNEDKYDNWELRKHRFVDEMRPVLFQYMGITPDSYVLDCGCGTGVLARYIARGLGSGRVLGFDISRYLVDYGNARIADENLSDVCKLVVADGFELPFDDNTFDAVTNYTYMGVLSDPVAGLKEMIRVCKKGGTVSSITPVRGVEWKGEYPLDFAERLHELYDRQEEIYRKYFFIPKKCISKAMNGIP